MQSSWRPWREKERPWRERERADRAEEDATTNAFMAGLGETSSSSKSGLFSMDNFVFECKEECFPLPDYIAKVLDPNMPESSVQLMEVVLLQHCCQLASCDVRVYDTSTKSKVAPSKVPDVMK